MAAITVNIPNQGIDDICTRFGYKTQILDNSVPPVLIPNPQTKLEFAKVQLITWAKSQIREHRVNSAAATAGATAGADVDANIIVN